MVYLNCCKDTLLIPVQLVHQALSFFSAILLPVSQSPTSSVALEYSSQGARLHIFLLELHDDSSSALLQSVKIPMNDRGAYQ